MKKIPLSLKNYSDIFNSVLPIVIELKQDYELEGSCIPFNFFAYAILKECFKEFNSFFMMGNVIYQIKEYNLIYYDLQDNKSVNNWHTFIFLDYDNNRYYLDFMAPLFNDILRKQNSIEDTIERKMFQKNISERKLFTDDNIRKFLEGEFNDGDYSFIVDENLRSKNIKEINNNEILQHYAKLAIKLFNSKENYIIENYNGYQKEISKTITKTNYKIEKSW